MKPSSSFRRVSLAALVVMGCAQFQAHAQVSAPLPAPLQSQARQAMERLDLSARHKVRMARLDELFSRESNDVLVEFQDDDNVAAEADQPQTRERRSWRKRQLLARLGKQAELLEDFDRLPMSFKRVRSSQGLAALLSDPDVKAVYPNVAHQRLDLQSLPLINQPYASGSGYKGQGTSVAVLDSGLDYTRDAFGKCTLPGYPSTCRVVAASDIAFPDFARDTGSYHGTNVAGIIAAVAPATRLIGLDVFTASGAMTNDLVRAVNWVIANKAKYNIVAMNMSLGDSTKSAGECPGSWATTPFANARAAGVIPVVAAGNSSAKDGLASPACAPGAVRVGAVYDSNVGGVKFSACSDAATAADQVTCFSQSSPVLSLLAPGATITAAGISMSGTSQAAPHVAGAIAVLRGTNAAPNDTLDGTIRRLQATGVRVTDARNGVTTPRIDLLKALQTLGQPSP
ncbi:MAG: hypothetical protein RLZZ182_209 [Pseudomonadota bacterium]